MLCFLPQNVYILTNVLKNLMPSPRRTEQCQQWRRPRKQLVQLSQTRTRQNHLGSFKTYSFPDPDSTQEPGSCICKTPEDILRQTFD